MHKLIEYVCDQLDELERKVDKGGQLSMTEVQFGDTLAHFKKNLLSSEEMMMGYSGDYSGDDMSNRRSYNDSYMPRSSRRSYDRGRGRNARRDSMGRYSSDDGYSGAEIADKLRELMADAPDERTRKEIQKLADKMEDM